MVEVFHQRTYYIYIYFAFNTFVAMREDLYPDYTEEVPAPTVQRSTVKAEPDLIPEDLPTEDEYDDSFEP